MQGANPFWLIAAATLVAALPVILGLFTAYLKVSIVLGIIRNALGTQQVPSSLVVMAISLALTGYIMTPVLEQIFDRAQTVNWEQVLQKPSLENLSQLKICFEPVSDFLQRHSGQRETLALQQMLAQEGRAAGMQVTMLAFVLSELREGFVMAFSVLLPFLVIDIIVANVLVGLGMFMVSPVMIALPIKILLFVLADGWLLIVKGLLNSYSG